MSTPNNNFFLIYPPTRPQLNCIKFKLHATNNLNFFVWLIKNSSKSRNFFIQNDDDDYDDDAKWGKWRFRRLSSGSFPRKNETTTSFLFRLALCFFWICFFCTKFLHERKVCISARALCSKPVTSCVSIHNHVSVQWAALSKIETVLWVSWPWRGLKKWENANRSDTLRNKLGLFYQNFVRMSKKKVVIFGN